MRNSVISSKIESWGTQGSQGHWEATQVPFWQSDITHPLWDTTLEETWNLRRTPRAESFSGKAQGSEELHLGKK